MEQSSSITLITCPIFNRELTAVLTQIPQPVALELMDYNVHNSAQQMSRELQDGVKAALVTGNKVRFLVGCECKSDLAIKTIVTGCGGAIPIGKNCIEILFGVEETRRLEAGRTCLMTVGWMEMITRSIAEGNWTETDARLNLGWYDRILILDTGVASIDDEALMAFYELTQVPIEIQAMTLDHFKQVVTRLLTAEPEETGSATGATDRG